ncbi:unnamed protein product [Gordionus sp. m RMFG-2023]|uniref:uncharacterized protein LOC135928254 isoform X2 n=1 Tax=Gordionus sp. m RMFG-2023 TaxID=3053472 RepID=UPI0030E015BA
MDLDEDFHTEKEVDPDKDCVDADFLTLNKAKNRKFANINNLPKNRKLPQINQSIDGRFLNKELDYKKNISKLIISYIYANRLYCVLVILIIFAILPINLFSKNDTFQPNISSKFISQFDKNIKDSSTFKNMNTRELQIIKSAILSKIEKSEPNSPSIVIIAETSPDLKIKKPNLDQHHSTIFMKSSNYETKNLLLAKTLGKIISNIYQENNNKIQELDKIINLNTLLYNSNIDEQKLKIVQMLTKYKNEDVKVFIIIGLENISGKTALIFHSICDQNDSPFKSAHFFFPIYIDKNMTNQNFFNLCGKTFDNSCLLEAYLTDKWRKSIGIDRIAALFSRIGNNIVNI